MRPVVPEPTLRHEVVSYSRKRELLDLFIPFALRSDSAHVLPAFSSCLLIFPILICFYTALPLQAGNPHQTETLVRSRPIDDDTYLAH